MFANFLKPPQLLDEDSIQWMFDVFAWALQNFDASVFVNQTALVTPTNEHFPGSESSADGMAQLIFNKVKTYAGMQHWPCKLMEEGNVEEIPAQRIQLEGPIRGAYGDAPAGIDDSKKLLITYNEEQLRDPQVLIASFAHTLSHYLGTTAQEPPPGGEENWPHVTELLAVFIGFGIPMANSSNTKKIRSCGSCSGPAVERTNFLSEYDISYALAMFCCLKNIPASAATKQLKSSLRPFFKKAVKDVLRRKPALSHVQSLALSTV